MPLSKERRTYGLILGLVLAGLGVDRFLAGGPATASAASVIPSHLADPLVSAQAPVPSPVLLSPVQQASAQLATRLRGLGVATDELATLTDPFIVPEQVAAAVTEEVSVVTSPPPPPPNVTAILFGPSPAVIADGRSLRLGDLIGAWTLVAITQDVAEFDCDGVRIERRVR